MAIKNSFITMENALTDGSYSICFRKEIKIKKPIKTAKASVVGLGFFRFSINGREIGDDVLSPLESNYKKCVLFEEYDITDSLNLGANALGIEVGTARFSPKEKYQDWRARWYGFPCASAFFEITYCDGSLEEIYTDTTWKCQKGTITSNCFYDGEIYDANLKTDWNTEGFDDNDWQNAIESDFKTKELVPNNYFNIKRIRTIKPNNIFKTSTGTVCYDFGENNPGWCRIRVKGNKGTKVILHHAEDLENGLPQYKSNERAENTDTYILSGDGIELYEPKFTLHGFSVVETTIEGDAEILEIEAVVVHADLKTVGHFTCDNADLNRLHEIILRTQCAALMSYPLDCPQRDERLGWLGDAHVTDLTCLYNFKVEEFYKKWFQDIYQNCDNADGKIPFIAPFFEDCEAIDWSTGFPIIVLDNYLFYKDKSIVKKYFGAFENYVKYLTRDGYILPRTRYGDWLCTQEGWVRGDPACCSSLYLYYNILMLVRFAKILGNSKKEEKYNVMKNECKEAILKEFYTKGKFDDNTQFSVAFALMLGLIPKEDTDTMLNVLIGNIENHDCHLTTGILGTKYVMEVLHSFGKHDLIMRLLLQTTYPSWLDMIKDRTTLSENWDGSRSHNHCMFGSVDAIFYKALVGIEIGEEVTVSPKFVKELNYVKGDLELKDGTIGVEWKKTDGKIALTVTVTDNLSVILKLDGTDTVLTEGIYNYSL